MQIRSKILGYSTVDWAHMARFNSANSSELLSKYESFLDRHLKELRAARTPSKAMVASSFRCNRISWFRLRGVTPDNLRSPDAALRFTADMGTAMHERLQTHLQEMLQADWLSVEEYLESRPDIKDKYDISVSTRGLETGIRISDPPVQFSCDGILKYNGKVYLLEIKSADYASWNNLTDPKPEHIDQVKFYATFLGLEHVLMLYQDRAYGELKCYEFRVSDSDKQEILDRVAHIQDYVEKCIAPEPLPSGDKWCSENYCDYYQKCKEYGR